MNKMVMALLAGLGAMVLGGCATYSVGVSTMAMEREKQEYETGVKQNLSGITVSGSEEYYELSVGTLSGTITLTEDNGYGKEVTESQDVQGLAVDLFFKYPFYLLNDRLTLFPLAGFEYRMFGSEYIGEEVYDILPYLKLGGGLDFTFSRTFFLRASLTYTFGLLSGITGTTFSASLGFRAEKDPVRKRYMTGAEIRAANIRKKAKTAMETGDWNAAVDAYTQIIAEEPGKAEHYFARFEAYLGAKDYDAAAQDFNKGTELGIILPLSIDGRPQKWRELYREYREAKGAEAPILAGRAVVVMPQSSHLAVVTAKTPGLEGAQGSGDEMAVKAGRQTLAFRYSGALADLTAMTIGDCSLTFDLKEGRVYQAVAGFDGRDFTIRIDDVTGRETGLNEEEEPAEVTTLTANMFYTNRFKKGMTVAALRRAGFSEAWDASVEDYYLTGIGSGDRRMTFGAQFGDDGLSFYDLVMFGKYKSEMIDLLSSACTGPITLDNGNLSWISSAGIIIMKDISDNRLSVFETTIMPLGGD